MRRILLLSLLVVCAACGDDNDDANQGPDRAPVLAQYAALVHANYQDALTTAQAMDTAIDAFLADRTEANFAAAKEAWKVARRPYGQTEAFRFYDGPIDNPADGPEGQLNAWPMDEAYVDYVDGDEMAGIINDRSIDITAARLAGLNEGAEGDVLGQGDGFDADAAVSTGFHAIEFLLWGQDRNASGPGDRPYTDFEDMGTASNQDRRRQYLEVVTDLVVADLESLVQAWAPNADNYRASFVQGDPDTQLRLVIAAIGILAKGELGGERIDVALTTQDQEDEHSCFSDNTHVDVQMNALGIQNVYTGSYGSLTGPSISDLVRAADADLDQAILTLLSNAVGQANTMPVPFDQAITDPSSDDYAAVNTLVTTLFDLGDELARTGPALGLGQISVELPE